MTGPDGQTTRYEYYRDNSLYRVVLERASEPDRVFEYSHDAAGRLLAIIYPEDSEIVATFDDGTETEGSGWDANGNLLHLRYKKGGVLLRRFAYSYDDSGNRASLLDVTPSKAGQVGIPL